MRDFLFFSSDLVPANAVVMMDDEYIAYIEILEMPDSRENLVLRVDLHTDEVENPIVFS